MDINKLLRKNIKSLKAYSSARNEFSGNAITFLDANENPYNTSYNRYPDPLQHDLKLRIAEIKKCDSNRIFLGNGSDEAIDLLFRAFCEPNVDNIVSISPSYGMYQVAADINSVEIRNVELDSEFNFNADSLLKACDNNTKLAFICSPNNPSGNLLNKAEIIKLLDSFKGIVVLDEAYIDFCPNDSFLFDLNKYPNLVILQTFSKAWGMAGIRLGMAFASLQIIDILNKIKYPYNINILTQRKALELLKNTKQKDDWVRCILEERGKLFEALQELSYVDKIYHSDSNFLLVKVNSAEDIYSKLVERGIIVRNRSKIVLCNNCLRITVGTPAENISLLKELKALE